MIQEPVWQGGKPARGTLVKCKAKSERWKAIIVKGPRGNKEYFTKYFSASKYGGKDGAIEASKIWREEKSHELGMTKNRYRYIRNDLIEVQLCRGIMVTNARFLPVVERAIWTMNVQNYAVNSKGERFHSVITGYEEVDHINRDRLDNRDENLRSVTHQENANNQSMSILNTSGVVGVSKCTDRSYNYWRVHWTENGKRHCRTFSIGRYGEEEAKRLAIATRMDADNRTGTLNGKAVLPRPSLELQ